jgi:bacterioferritin
MQTEPDRTSIPQRPSEQQNRPATAESSSDDRRDLTAPGETPGAEREGTIHLLNQTLAVSMVGALRYRQHAFLARGDHGKTVARSFFEHARAQDTQADRLAERIVDLGGEPNFDPNSLAARSHGVFLRPASLIEMIRDNLRAERSAVDRASRLVRYFGDRDPTSRRIVEEILQRQEAHTTELRKLLAIVGDRLDDGANPPSSPCRLTSLLPAPV